MSPQYPGLYTFWALQGTGKRHPYSRLAEVSQVPLWHLQRSKFAYALSMRPETFHRPHTQHVSDHKFIVRHVASWYILASRACLIASERLSTRSLAQARNRHRFRPFGSLERRRMSKFLKSLFVRGREKGVSAFPLPLEILEAIAALLALPDLYRVVRVSRACREVVEPFLYMHLPLAKYPQRALRCCATLLARHDLARAVISFSAETASPWNRVKLAHPLESVQITALREVRRMLEIVLKLKC